ncbi:MAG TPA: DNRLRE domain-containing protein [Humisphaera sp.]|nr:DNRLRE domain-containing protein [Humisphaera sp.]
MPPLRHHSARRAVASAARACIETLEGRRLLSTVLTPVADTYTRDHSYALTNFGASPLLFVKKASSGDDRITFLKFDLSGISNITGATLTLTGKLQNNLSSPVDAGVFGVSDSSWVEGDGSIVNNNGDGFDTDNSPAGEMTWNNQPTVDSSPIDSVNIHRTSFQTLTFDVSSYLQAQLNAGKTLVTLAVQDVEASDQFLVFQSRESSGSGASPKLTINTGQAQPLSAAIAAPDITSPSSSQTITVTYSGGTGIDTSTIDPSNLSVTGPSGALDVTGVTFSNGAGTKVIATYTVAAPQGNWSASDNGTYEIALAGGAVTDLSGAPVPATLGSFVVSVGDTSPPSSVVNATDVNAAGAATYSFVVTYNDDVAIDASTITIDNVAVTGPAGTLKVLNVSLSPNHNAASIDATYTVAAPGGAWDATENGTYQILVHDNQIMDTAGNTAPINRQNFAVNIAAADITAPTAQITSAPDINSPGGATQLITVVYSDDIAVDASTIDTGDITVAGPGGSVLSVTAVSFTPSGNSRTITAHYTLAAPGGSWDASDNGTYTVNVNPGAILDTSGNSVGGTNGAFNVSAASVDNTPPDASISAPPITSPGDPTQTVTVIFTDNLAVDASSIDSSDISVSGPGGPLTVTGVSFNPNGNSTSITATYTISAPSGQWDATANGTYSVAINANQVRDTSGNAVPIEHGAFVVNIPLPNPTDPSFANGSAVTTPFIGESLFAQADGKIIVVGHQLSTAGTSQGVIERLNADGSLDTTFANNGQIVTPTSTTDSWYAVAVQGANHFVVAGTHNGDFSLARFDSNGNLDPTFGNGGTIFTDFGGTADVAYAVAIAQDQTIVAAGSSNHNFAVVRYDANGHLNTKFGAGGRQVFDTGGTSQVLGAVTVDSAGRIVAAGASDSKLDVIRLTSVGDPDTTFDGGGGMVVVSDLAARVDSANPDFTEGLAIQGDGKILVGNRTTDGHFGVVRLKTDGTTDSTFGSSGLASANFGGDDDVDTIVVQPDTGNILVIGTSLQAGVPSTAIAAFDSGGKAITGFGNSGKVLLDASLAPTSRQLHIGDIFERAFGAGTAEGKLVVGTSSTGSTTTTSTLRRLIVPGSKNVTAIQPTFLGAFGIINGKKTKLQVTDFDGTRITIVLSGGQGQATQNGDKIDLTITAGSTGCAVTITTKGGDGRGAFGSITITGSVKSLNAKTSDVSGTLAVSGAAGRISLGNITGNVLIGNSLASLTAGNLGGTLSVGADARTIKLHDVSGVIAVGGSIRSLTATSLTNSKILAGTQLGSDNAIGGSGSAADTIGAGFITTLRVNGAITSSFIGAGVSPVNSIYGDNDDTEAGGALSIIRSISAKSADSATRFEAAGFKSAKLPKKVDPTTDSRFKILA